jgi:hypothetical protein
VNFSHIQKFKILGRDIRHVASFSSDWQSSVVAGLWAMPHPLEQWAEYAFYQHTVY